MSSGKGIRVSAAFMIALAVIATVLMAVPSGSALLGGKLSRTGGHWKNPAGPTISNLVPSPPDNTTTGTGPDLLISQIYSVTTIDATNQTAFNTIYVEVYNNGDRTAPASHLAVGLRDAPSIAESQGNVSQNYTAQATFDLAPIDAHMSRTVEIPPSMYAAGSTVPGAFGVYRAEATIDPANDIAESNEANNSAWANVFGGEISTAQ
ncbi:MAG: CARDB domain-containing protein [Thermoplasmatota archaeon]